MLAGLPGFPTDRAGYISALQAHIAAGYNVENSERVLARILNETAEVEPLDGLSRGISYRVRSLEDFLNQNPPFHADSITNAEAIIKAYKDGSLSIETGKVSYWFNGKRKTALTRRDDVDLVEMVPKWREEEGGKGRVWEETGERVHQKAARASFLPSNDDDHHEVLPAFG